MYVEYLRALIYNEPAKKLGFIHYLSLCCNFGIRPKAYSKLLEITKKHYPSLFVITGWKAVVIDLSGAGDPKNWPPTFKSLAQTIKDSSEEKRNEFLRDIYACS